jgi:hypothetical protein
MADASGNWNLAQYDLARVYSFFAVFEVKMEILEE